MLTLMIGLAIYSQFKKFKARKAKLTPIPVPVK